MSYDEIIRAWKDPEYRMSLSEEELAQLPEHPAGLIDLADGEMDAVIGGGFSTFNFFAGMFGAAGTCGSHHQCCPKQTAVCPTPSVMCDSVGCTRKLDGGGQLFPW